MNDKFQDKINKMVGHFSTLQSRRRIRVSEATLAANEPAPKKSGIYVLYEEGRALYVGRSNDIKHRLRVHTTSDHMGASFAFMLAIENAKKNEIPIEGAKTRRDKLNIPEFRDLFVKSKERIKNMEVHWVDEPDPIAQAILEMYVHLELDTPYNNFNNH